MNFSISDESHSLAAATKSASTSSFNSISLRHQQVVDATSATSAAPVSSNTTTTRSTASLSALVAATSLSNPRIIRKRVREQLNSQRLALVDTLLSCGAGVDKYRRAQLSLDNQLKLNVKSRAMLAKWHTLITETPPPPLQHQQPAAAVAVITSRPMPQELKPMTPLVASLCLDDVDVFSRLHRYQRAISVYTRPDELAELVYYATRLEAQHCLRLLLSSMFSLTTSESNTSRKDIMFYVLEHTRSPRIVRALVDCGFDLSKREPLTGNTAIHMLFSPTRTLDE